MGDLKLNGATSGTITLTPTAVAGTTTITLPATTGTVVVSNSSGNASVSGDFTVGGTLTASGALVPSSSFKRNRIINGNMVVAQRGTSFTDGNGYTLDRWYGNRSGGVAGVTYAQVYGAFSTTTNSMSIQRTSGNTSTAAAVLYQAIEGINSRDLAGKTVTVSFQIGAGSISSTTGHSVIVYYQTTTTDIGPTSGSWTALTAQTFTVVASSSYTKKTFQFSIPSNATQLQLSIQFAFSGTAGADDRFYLTEVQLEQGSAATPYEMQIYSDQLAQCQRYFQQPTAWSGMGDSANSISAIFPYIVPMRSAATISAISGASLSWRLPGADASTTTWSLTAVNAFYNGVWLLFGGLGVATTSGASYQNRYLLGGNYLINASAEL